jgi:hypothetical protein
VFHHYFRDSCFDAVSRAIERVFAQAARHRRWWIVSWLVAVLAVACVAMICHAPPTAYIVLLTVLGIVLFADSRSGSPS